MSKVVGGEEIVRQTIANDIEHTVPLDFPLPVFSFTEGRMIISTQQWINGYLAQRDQFFCDEVALGERPTVTAFHNHLEETTGNKLRRLDKISMAIHSVSRGQLVCPTDSYVVSQPHSLTAEGVNTVLEKLRRGRGFAPEITKSTGSKRVMSPLERIGYFILKNQLMVYDPKTRTAFSITNVLTLDGDEDVREV